MNKLVTIPIINQSQQPNPYYATTDAAGMDLYAHLDEPITLLPFDRKLIPTGLYIALPKGYEAQIRARSSWALKRGLILPNAPGTIDADYRGEIKVILANISNEAQTIYAGDRIAQMVVSTYTKVNWQTVEQLPDTKRGTGGFGSTG